MTTEIGRAYLFLMCVYAVRGAADGAEGHVLSHAYFMAGVDIVAGVLFLATGLSQIIRIVRSFVVLWNNVEID